MYVVIINPLSGKGEVIKIWSQVETILLSKNIPYEAHICTSPELTRTYLQDIVQSLPLEAFIVIGGDGTVSCVLQQTANTTIPLAVLPAGSGNDIARNFNLTTEPDRFVSKLLEGRIMIVDLLYVNGIYGMTVAGIGMDAKIGMRADRSVYKRWLNQINRGSAAYTIAAILELLLYKPFNGKLFVDGNLVLHTDFWLAACGNMKMYGGGLVICPEANPCDGRINVTLLHNASRWKVLLKLFPELLKGKQVKAKEVTYVDGKEIIIEGDRVLPYVIDGETFHSDKVTFSIRPKMLKLVETS